MNQEKPSENPPSSSDGWVRIMNRPEFAQLLVAKRRFIVPCCVFFLLYYFAFLILVGWFPDLVKKPVIGKVNVAYLFALSQFVMAWGMAWLYMRRAAVYDRAVAEMLKKENL